MVPRWEQGEDAAPKIWSSEGKRSPKKLFGIYGTNWGVPVWILWILRLHKPRSDKMREIIQSANSKLILSLFLYKTKAQHKIKP